MSKNKTKLQLAVAWTLAIVFALSTLLLAVKLFYKTEDKTDDTVNAVENFASATALSATAPSLIKTGLNNNVSLMSTGEPSAQADAESYLDVNFVETFSVNMSGPSSTSNQFSLTYSVMNSSTTLFTDGEHYIEFTPMFASLGSITTYSVYGFDVYAGNILVYSSDRGTLGTSLGKSSSCTKENFTLTLEDLVSKGLNVNQPYEFTVEIIPMYCPAYSWVGSPQLCDPVEESLGTVTIVTSVDLPAAPTKTGYTFTGWYTDEACTKPYTDSTVTGNVTLYAGFTANTYSVKFNSNGGTGSMSNQTHTYDKSLALTANAFSKTGYHFAGWATSANGNVVYSNSQSVSNLASEQGATVNLYAKWEANNYTIKFNANGGSGSMPDLAMTYDSAKALTANTFTFDQYHFVGWSTTADGDVVHADKASVNNLTATNGGTVTLYAIWELNYYTITYKDGSTVVGTEEIITDTYASMPFDAPVKEGKTFIGWTLPDGTLYTNQVLNKNTVLTATYAITQYTISFIVDGELYHEMLVEHGTNLKELLDFYYPSLLYDAGEVDENF